jgi:hypothetical protein
MGSVNRRQPSQLSADQRRKRKDLKILRKLKVKIKKMAARDARKFAEREPVKLSPGKRALLRYVHKTPRYVIDSLLMGKGTAEITNISSAEISELIQIVKDRDKLVGIRHGHSKEDMLNILTGIAFYKTIEEAAKK